MERAVKQPTLEQQQIAQVLFGLTSLPFVPPVSKKNSPYLTLDVGEKQNKNAVNVFRGHVSFMVKDSAICELAKSRGFVVREHRGANSKREDRRLQFLELTPATILEHRDFFGDMLEAAYKESERRQGH